MERKAGGQYHYTRAQQDEAATEWYVTCPICDGARLTFREISEDGVTLTCRTSGCAPDEIRDALFAEYDAGTFLHADPLSSTSLRLAAEKAAWPEPPNPLAFHGLAGRAVDIIGPHTEADRTALLVQMLVAFGNAAGRGPGWRVGADVHHLNMFVALVGDTATGRKGTSWQRSAGYSSWPTRNG